MKLSIKGLKTMDGPDSRIFNCSVYVDGKRRFTAHNDGNGGCNMYHPVKPYAENRECLDLVLAWAKTEPERTCESSWGGAPFTYPCDLDCIVDDLIDAELDRRWLKAQCRKKTLFRLPDTPDGEYMTVNAKCDERVRAWVLDKHPDAVIVNGTV